MHNEVASQVFKSVNVLGIVNVLKTNNFPQAVNSNTNKATITDINISKLLHLVSVALQNRQINLRYLYLHFLKVFHIAMAH